MAYTLLFLLDEDRTDSTSLAQDYKAIPQVLYLAATGFFVSQRLAFYAPVDMDDRVVGHPRGKQLGGSSAINLMFWTHASQTDINDWGELGNKGWN